jgi:hypothetical protein
MARPAEVPARLRNWFYGFTPPERGAIVLGHRRVYIVPSRLGLLFGGALGILLIGSINYALSLGFALTFLLAGMGLAGMVQTARNLAQLTVRAGRAEPVFAGEAARFTLLLANAGDFDRPEILVRHRASGAQRTVDVGPASTAEAVLAVPAERRGWQPLGRVMLETRFPARPVPRLELRAARRPLPGLSAAGSRRTAAARAERAGGRRARTRTGQRRFFRPARLPAGRFAAHVAWKSVARSDTQHARSDDMLTKQFAGDAVAELWLDLADLPASLGLERCLSRLAGWVLAGERAARTTACACPARNSRRAGRAAPRRLPGSPRPVPAAGANPHEPGLRGTALPPEQRPLAWRDFALLFAASRWSSRRTRCARPGGSRCSPPRWSPGARRRWCTRSLLPSLWCCS